MIGSKAQFALCVGLLALVSFGQQRAVAQTVRRGESPSETTSRPIADRIEAVQGWLGMGRRRATEAQVSDSQPSSTSSQSRRTTTRQRSRSTNNQTTSPSQRQPLLPRLFQTPLLAGGDSANTSGQTRSSTGRTRYRRNRYRTAQPQSETRETMQQDEAGGPRVVTPEQLASETSVTGDEDAITPTAPRAMPSVETLPPPADVATRPPTGSQPPREPIAATQPAAPTASREEAVSLPTPAPLQPPVASQATSQGVARNGQSLAQARPPQPQQEVIRRNTQPIDLGPPNIPYVMVPGAGAPTGEIEQPAADQPAQPSPQTTITPQQPPLDRRVVTIDRNPNPVQPRRSTDWRGAANTAETSTPPATTTPPAAITPTRRQANPPRWAQPKTDDTVVDQRIQMPLLKLTHEGPEAISLGRQASYEITLTNPTTATAKQVDVRVAIPAWVTLGEPKATAGELQLADTQGGRVVLWFLPQVDARTSQKLRLPLTPEEARAFDLSLDYRQQPMQSSSQVAVLQAALEVDVTCPRELLHGQTQTVSVQVTNSGTGTAKNVSLDVATGDGSPQTMLLGTLTAGESKKIELDFTASRVGQANIQVAATGDGGLEASHDHALQVRAAQLALDAVGPEVRFVGTGGAYEFTISNTGDAPAANVQVTAELPAHAKVISASGAEASGKQLIWAIGTLAPGQQRTVHMQCQLNAAGDQQFRFNATGDRGLFAVSQVATRVDAVADLRLRVREPQGPLPTGKPVRYEIELANDGVKAAHEVKIVAHFSKGISPTSSTGGGEIEAGSVLFPTFEVLQPGEKKSFSITAMPTTEGSQYYRVEAVGMNPPARRASEGTTYFYKGQ